MIATSTQSLRNEQRSDEQLITDYLAGEAPCFEALVTRYHRELFHFLVRFTADRTLADDVFQETFLQVHQSLATFDSSRRLKPWLFTIAANKARDAIRAKRRRQSLPLSAPGGANQDEPMGIADLIPSNDAAPSASLEAGELHAKVQKAVAAMPDHLREVLLLSYFHQFPYKQISEMLDVPLGTVKSRLHAAVAHFADRWRRTEALHDA